MRRPIRCPRALRPGWILPFSGGRVTSHGRCRPPVLCRLVPSVRLLPLEHQLHLARGRAIAGLFKSLQSALERKAVADDWTDVDLPAGDQCHRILEFAVKARSEEQTSELQSPCNLECRLLLEKKKSPRRARRPAECSHSSSEAKGGEKRTLPR